MKKIFSFFAAMLVAVAVNAQTDFAVPGYRCAADDAILTGGSSSSFYLKTDVTPHCVAWSDVGLTANALATWTVVATRGCYVTVDLDLGPVIASNKHNFEVTIKDDHGNSKGKLTEGGENTASDQIKRLDGTILIPAAGTYTVEVFNNRDWGKGTIKNVILTYESDAPTSMIEVESIELNKTVLPLEVDEVEQLAATVLPLDAFDPSVTWSSSDDDIVTVVDGLVTAVATGNATITAKAGEKTATCAVTVSAAVVPSTDFAEPLALTAKKAHLEGAVWKKYEGDTYKLYGEGGHNKFYGNAFWTINVTRPCIVSGVLNGVEGGHMYELDLFAGDDSITTAIQSKGEWSHGEIALDANLTFAATGVYTLRLRNTQQWSSGMIAGVTLTFVEEITAEPVAVAKDFEIDMRTDVMGGNEAYLVAGEPNEFFAAAPAEYNAHFVAQGHSGDHGYNQLIATVPVEVGKYKVTLGNCQYAYSADYTMAYVKNAAQTETLASVKQNYTQDEEGAVCYHQNTVNNVAVMEFTVDAAQMVIIKCAHYTPYIKFEKVTQDPTGLEDAIEGGKVVKMIENGQMIIIKNGVRYNVQGAIMK